MTDGRLGRLHALDTARTRRAPQPRLKPRGLPPALEPHGVYSAANPAEAARYGRDLLGVHRVHVDSGEVDEFLATFHGVRIRDVTLGYLDYSTDVTVEVEALPHDHLVIVPATGASEIVTRGDTIAATPVMAAVLAPGSGVTIRCGRDTAHVILRIDRAPFEVHLSRLLGRVVDRPLEFAPALDLSTGTASRWNFAVQMLHAELFDPESLLRGGVGLGQLEEFVMSSLLYTQPSSYSDQLLGRHRTPGPAVRQACEFIDTNLAERITIGDIAAAAGVSVRTLQNHFTEELEQTPTAYVKNQRLDRVRADLADAPPNGGATVTDVAARWGFTHLGRFAATYRARFGESPSKTLRS